MNVFEAAAKLTLDSSEYKKGLIESENEAEKSGSKISQILSKVGKAIGVGATAAATAVGALVKQSVESYAEYEQLVGGVETLFDKSAEKVQAYADIAYKTAGLSANEYMENVTSFSASLLQSLGGDTDAAAEVANRAMIDMSDNANKMGTNMESIQNAYQGFAKQNYTMLDNLKLGYGGTKEEMVRLISDASKMTDVQKKLGITVDASSTSFGNIVNAISVMQASLGIAGTTALEAETTISGSLGMMKASWQNLLVAFADGSRDIGPAIDALVQSAGTAVNNLVPVIGQALAGIGNFVQQIAPVVSQQLPGMVGALLPQLLSAAAQLVGGVIGALPGMLQALAPAATEAIIIIVQTLLSNLPAILQAAMQIVATLVSGIGKALPTLIPAAVQAVAQLVSTFYNNLPQIIKAGMDLLLGLVNGILNAIPTLVAELPNVIKAMVNYFTSAIPIIVDTGVKLLDSLVTNLPSIINTIVGALPKIISSIVNFFTSSIPQIVKSGVELLSSLIKNLPQIISNILTAIPKIITGIVGAFAQSIPQIVKAGVELFVSLIKDLPRIIVDIVKAVPQIIAGIVRGFAGGIGDMVNVGGELLKGVWQGLSNAGDWLWGKVKGLFSSLTDRIKNFFGIHSPSTVFAEIGKRLDEGLGKGITDNSKSALKPLQNLADEMSSIAITPKVESDLRYNYSSSGSMGGLSAWGNGGVTININGANKDPEEIARAVEKVFVRWQNQREAAFV